MVPHKDSDLPPIEWISTNWFYDYYHGYTKLEKEGTSPQYHFGFGLSYTSFSHTEAEFILDGKNVIARCLVTNVGVRYGEQVVQLYAGFENSEQDRPIKILCGFTRIALEAGESQIVVIKCPLKKLEWYNPELACFVLERMDYNFYIGSSSKHDDLLAGKINI